MEEKEQHLIGNYSIRNEGYINSDDYTPGDFISRDNLFRRLRLPNGLYKSGKNPLLKRKFREYYNSVIKLIDIIDDDIKNEDTMSNHFMFVKKRDIEENIWHLHYVNENRLRQEIESLIGMRMESYYILKKNVPRNFLDNFSFYLDSIILTDKDSLKTPEIEIVAKLQEKLNVLNMWKRLNPSIKELKQYFGVLFYTILSETTSAGFKRVFHDIKIQRIKDKLRSDLLPINSKAYNDIIALLDKYNSKNRIREIEHKYESFKEWIEKRNFCSLQLS